MIYERDKDWKLKLLPLKVRISSNNCSASGGRPGQPWLGIFIWNGRVWRAPKVCWPFDYRGLLEGWYVVAVCFCAWQDLISLVHVNLIFVSAHPQILHFLFLIWRVWLQVVDDVRATRKFEVRSVMRRIRKSIHQDCLIQTARDDDALTK